MGQAPLVARGAGGRTL